jgi:hypothetical protein
MITAFVALASFASLAAEPPHEGAKGHRKRWEESKYGLFIHHVYGAGLEKMTPLSREGGFPGSLDDFVSGFQVERFAEEVKGMGFEYVIFTAWHFNMNALYPSRLMDTWRGPGHSTSERDLLGEIIKALRKRGIMAALYSHVFVGHEFRPDNKPGYYTYDRKDGLVTDEMRRTGYYPAASAPWGPQPPPPETLRWNNFINQIYDEMTARYGSSVEAMYFDGSWVWMVDRQRLFATIRKNNPTAALVANGTPDHGFEYSSKEVGSPSGKDYGFASEVPGVVDSDAKSWPGYRRHVALIAGSNWWASVPGGPRFSAEDIARYTALQACTSDAGGIGWSFGTYADGSFENGLAKRFREAWRLLKPISTAIRRTVRSRAYPTSEGQTIKTLPGGFAASESADGRRTYVHVLRPPEGELKLPAPQGGLKFRQARLLGKAGKVKMTVDEDGALTISLSVDWDPVNTVISLEHSR